MIASPSLESAARELLARQWHQLMHPLEASAGHAEETSDECPVLWALPELLELVAETHDQPVENLTPMVRRLLLEGNFVDDNGDSVVGSNIRDIQQHVEVIIKVLEEIRQAALEEGRWSNAPVTPLMFG